MDAIPLEGSDSPELQAATDDARRACLRLYRHMLAALPPALGVALVELVNDGIATGIEVTTDKFGANAVRLVAIDAKGTRRMLASVATSAPKSH